MRVMQTSRRTYGGRPSKRKADEAKEAKETQTKRKKSRAADIPSTESGSSEQKALIHINEFPPHVLGLVFSKIPLYDRLRAEKVCRFWRVVSIAGYGWADQATISYEEIFSNAYIEKPEFLTNRHIEILLKRTRQRLRSLDLSSFHHHEQINYSLCSSFQMVKNLRTLNMSSIQLTNSSLSLIGRTLIHLEKVSFHESFKGTITDRGLHTLFSHCRKLKELDLSGNEVLAGTSFSELPSTLIVLNVSGCYRLKTDAIRGIQHNCVNLQKLMFNSLDTVPTIHLNDMFRSLKNLTHLHFCECYGTEFYDGQPSLISLGDLTKLKELRLADNMLINNDVLQAIGLGCKQLEILDISLANRNVTDAGLRHITNLNNLVELNLAGQRAITDDTLIHFVNNVNRSALRVLILAKCTSISNESVLQIIKKCKNLKTLDVSYCIGVTPVIFKELDKAMSAQHGKSQPTGVNDEQKFRLSILRSGVHNNIPDKYSPWIKIVDCCNHAASAFFLAHFLDFPLAAGMVFN